MFIVNFKTFSRKKFFGQIFHLIFVETLKAIKSAVNRLADLQNCVLMLKFKSFILLY